MKFCAITPDRGDRPQFTEHMLFQMGRQTLKPDAHYLVNSPPKGKGFDLVSRVKAGIKQAEKDGFEYAFIIENDDYYPDDYFEKMQFEGYNFIGIEETIYYHIGIGKYNIMNHNGRSSLFCTGIYIPALKDFLWPPDDIVFLDLELWKYAKKAKLLSRYPGRMPIGIKHNTGLCGGTGHNEKSQYQYSDENMEFLKKAVCTDSFEFYKSFKK